MVSVRYKVLMIAKTKNAIAWSGSDAATRTSSGGIADEAAPETYRRRGAAAEFPNAFCRNHGLSQFRVRGRLKVPAQSL